jgi:pyruvate kinase
MIRRKTIQSPKKKTKIIATLGPSSYTVTHIEALIEAGMDIARLNLSHGSRESHALLIDNVKQARSKHGAYTAVLLDTRGPEIRFKDLGEGVELIVGETVVLNGGEPKSGTLPVNYPGIAGDVAVGSAILLDDGKMRLQTIAVDGSLITARVVVGGTLLSRKRVSLPDVEVRLPSLTAEDELDIIFGVEQGVDIIAASFVRTKEDVLAVREVIKNGGGEQIIIAKIENRQGVDNLTDILEAADGLMVARGDLGVEMPAEEVPIIQKKIIKAANRAGKPVITATQMLESMILSPTPTRAEAGDVTNAIFDGTDAVMLSGETAVGAYPVQSVRFLVKNALISEAALNYDAILLEGLRHRRPVITDAISYASCATAADLTAAAIITATTSGATARRVARYRPKTPIIAISPNEANLRMLQLFWGVIPLQCPLAQTMDEQTLLVVQTALKAGLIEPDDLVVITAGFPVRTSGTTNMLKVYVVGDANGGEKNES